jgi:hypothetical protein
MSIPLLLTLVVYLLIAGCNPSTPPESNNPQKTQATKTDRTHLRRALNNIQMYLGDLEGRLRISNEQTWSLEASTARNALGSIQLQVSTLRQDAQDVGMLESLLSELDDSLRGASTDNWRPNASTAQQIVGNIRMELQHMNRRLSEADREKP